MPSRDELRALAELRLQEAVARFGAGFYDGSVYLCGYVVELALKARICTVLGVADYPDSEMPQAFKIHNFDHLLLLSGLRGELNAGNAVRLTNWSTATDWKPEWRYRKAGSVDQPKAQEVLDALRDAPDGILTWLRQRW
jgi:hypothetical protein